MRERRRMTKQGELRKLAMEFIAVGESLCADGGHEPIQFWSVVAALTGANDEVERLRLQCEKHISERPNV